MWLSVGESPQHQVQSYASVMSHSEELPTCGVAALNHEGFDVTVEAGPIVVTARAQGKEIFGCSRDLQGAYRKFAGRM